MFPRAISFTFPVLETLGIKQANKERERERERGEERRDSE
jgi:hypothetical protein